MSDSNQFDFARGTSNLKRSVMRDLLKHAVDPEIISLAGGLPASEFLPVKEFQTCIGRVIDRDGAAAMQYSPMIAGLRDWIAGYMNRRGVTCTKDEVFITNGGQQSLTIISQMLLDPGDPAVIEALVFTGVQQVTAGRGANIRTVPTDLETGVDTTALETVFSETPRPKLAVLIPDFHNPLGVSLTPEKRRKIAELARKYEVPVIEDDPYSPLRFEGDLPTPIKGYDETGHILYAGSFSKMLSPSMRLGWIVAPEAFIPKITVIRESIDLESSTLMQRAVCEFLVSGMLEEHLARFNPRNKIRKDIMMDALEEHFSNFASWTRPEGGLFTWVTLPSHVDTWAMFDSAIEQKVCYIPGTAFSIRGDHKNTMRLNFSNVSPDHIREGVARLARVIQPLL